MPEVKGLTRREWFAIAGSAITFTFSNGINHILSSSEIEENPQTTKEKAKLHKINKENPVTESKEVNSEEIPLISDTTVNEVIFGSFLTTCEFTRLIERNYKNYHYKKAPFDRDNAEDQLIWHNSNLAALAIATPITLFLSAVSKPALKNYSLKSYNNEHLAENSATMNAFHMQSIGISLVFPALTEYFRDQIIKPAMEKNSKNITEFHPYAAITFKNIAKALKDFCKNIIPTLINKAKDSAERRALFNMKTLLELSVADLSSVLGTKLPGDQTDIARFLAMIPRQTFSRRVFLEGTKEENIDKQLPLQTGMVLSWPVCYLLLTLWNKSAGQMVPNNLKAPVAMAAATLSFFVVKASIQEATMEELMKGAPTEAGEKVAKEIMGLSENPNINPEEFSSSLRKVGQIVTKAMDKLDSNQFSKTIAELFKPLARPTANYISP